MLIPLAIHLNQYSLLHSLDY